MLFSLSADELLAILVSRGYFSFYSGQSSDASSKNDLPLEAWLGTHPRTDIPLTGFVKA